jgi:hypothetical protein
MITLKAYDDDSLKIIILSMIYTRNKFLKKVMMMMMCVYE